MKDQRILEDKFWHLTRSCPRKSWYQRLWYIELIIQPLKETNTSLRIHSVSHQVRPSHKVISAALVYHEHSDTSDMLIEDDTTGRFPPTDLHSTNFGINGKWKLPMIPILRRLEHSIFYDPRSYFQDCEASSMARQDNTAARADYHLNALSPRWLQPGSTSTSMWLPTAFCI